ncbi:hypothetical protein [uncultured Actinomyces sp.]|uniref:hypothetical protein n=1 Tax=uncultured Actinomyces sp. TaxID=249061 RepID=UPI00288B0516|nr:hypothetical protein [uncultured Actinomyces sp.]
MTDEIELICDGEGLAVLGDPTAVKRFLDSEGLRAQSQELRLERLRPALETGSNIAEFVSDIYANTGRYVRLTKESAEDVRRFGLMPTSVRGISHAMIGEPGSISKWIQIEDGPASLFMNPAVLSGVAGIMAQIARQQEVRALKELLVSIDGKLDDLRRGQRDEILAKMDRAVFVISEAMIIRERGGDRETAWRKVENEVGTIAEVQANALREIEALADKVGDVDDGTGVGFLKKTTNKIESEVGVWLAVLAQCFRLENERAILELDHVLATNPRYWDGHRIGLSEALHEKRDEAVRRTTDLLERLDRAGAVAGSNIILHAPAAHSVIDSVNAVNGSLEEFHALLGGESHWKELARIRWKDAIHDPNQLRRAGKETVKTVATKGAAVVAVVGLLYAAASAGGENNDSENSSGDDPEDSMDDESEESWDDE